MTVGTDWRELRSPTTGAVLTPDGPHAVRDRDGRRWPVVDAIPYLRTGRDALVSRALACLDAGDRPGALVVLLADQDDWWTGPAPEPADLRRLVAEADHLDLRAAMSLLGFGRVGDYFAHRWSDPTYLAGLGLIEAHRGTMASAFELACGIGHYGREFQRRGVGYAGADVVFAKLWLARHWTLGPAARLVCFDAAAPWPVADGNFALVLCQDAFYFLEPKAEILASLRGLVAPDGWLAVGHIHNRAADNHSAGRAMTLGEVVALFPDGILYDDLELTRAVASGRAPVPGDATGLRSVEAFAVAAGPRPAMPARSLAAGYAIPPEGARLVTNPLYGAEAPDGTELAFPSERYAAEYGALATYPTRFVAPVDAASRAAAIRCRALVDLPERW